MVKLCNERFSLCILFSGNTNKIPNLTEAPRDVIELQKEWKSSQSKIFWDFVGFNRTFAVIWTCVLWLIYDKRVIT